MLISWEGVVKLSDFGAAFAQDRQRRTQAGMVKGTRRHRVQNAIARRLFGRDVLRRPRASHLFRNTLQLADQPSYNFV